MTFEEKLKAATHIALHVTANMVHRLLVIESIDWVSHRIVCLPGPAQYALIPFEYLDNGWATLYWVSKSKCSVNSTE